MAKCRLLSPMFTAGAGEQEEGVIQATVSVFVYKVGQSYKVNFELCLPKRSCSIR